MVQNQEENSVWKNDAANRAGISGASGTSGSNAAAAGGHAGNASVRAVARKQASAHQGTAKDAYRVLDRHQKQVARTSNRTMVSSYTGTKDKQENHMFNAVSPLDGVANQNQRSTFGEQNARGTWRTASNAGFSHTRAKQRKEKLTIAAFAVVLIVIIVFLVLLVRSCAG